MCTTGLLLLVISSAATAAEVPDYRPLGDWLKLPEGLVLGPVSAAAIAPDGTFFVLQRSKKKPVLVFAADGTFLRSWGDETFKTGHGLRIDPAGNVWATDIGNHQVYKFDRTGRLLLTLGQRGKAGVGADQFDRPTDVAFAPNGDFFVTDGYGNSRVVKFSKDGKRLLEWGKKGKGDGEFNLPHSICTDGKGRLFVGDRENDRVELFDYDGKFLGQWTESGAPFGLCLAGTRLFVADGRAGWIVILDDAGKRVGRFAVPGKLSMPHMLCVDRDGAVYVAEVGGKRLQKFAPR